jgi:GTPase SAR1 family protein
MENTKELINCVMIGDSGVGKTWLTNVFFNKKPTNNIANTELRTK